MDHIMKIGRRILICLAIGLVWLLLYSVILWKIPFYIYINRLVLPAGSEPIKTRVCITDEGTWFHVIAEKVFISNWEEKEVIEYIEEINKLKTGVAQNYRAGIFKGMDHQFEYIIDGEEIWRDSLEEQYHYYMIIYTSLYDDAVIETVFYVAIYSEIAVIILSMIILVFLGERKRKKDNEHREPAS